MRLVSISKNDESIRSSAKILANALLDNDHEGPVFVDDAVALTGLPPEEARGALIYLAVRNAGRPMMIDGRISIDFDSMTREPDGLDGPIARMFSGFGRYVWDLGTSQFSYLLGMALFIGPAFLGYTALMDGLAKSDLLYILFGGTLAFGSIGAILSIFIRSLTVFLPVLIVLGVVLGWTRWTLGDFQWIPLVFVIALAMQVETLFRYRSHKMNRAFRQLFWGKGLDQKKPDSQKLTQLIVAKGGVVQLGDLMKTFGWTAQEAGDEITDILFDYGGDIEVDDAGRFVLVFQDIGFSGDRYQAPMPAYREETHAPKLFEGMDIKWIVIITIVSILGFLTSPFNPIYADYVAGMDFTMEGVGLIARFGLGAMFSIPPFVYMYRFFQNVLAKDEFTERREFLDKMAYAARHAGGSYVQRDHFDAEELIDLGAEFDIENTNDRGEIWVTFPQFVESQRPAPAASTNIVFEDVHEEEFEKVEQVFERNARK